MKAFPALMLLAGLIVGWGVNSLLTEPEVQGGALARTSGSTGVDASISSQEPHPDIAPSALSADRRSAPSTESIISAFRGALASSDARVQVREFIALLDLITKENAPAIAKAIAGWPESDPGAILCKELFFQHWGATVGLQAVDALRHDEGQPGGVSGAIASVLHGWATKDLPAVRSYADSLADDDPVKQLAIAAVVETLCRRDLSEGAAYAFGQPDGAAESAQYAMDLVLKRAKAAGRTDLFAEWFQRAPEGAWKPFMATRTIDALRQNDPAGAAAFIADFGEASWRNWDMYWPTARAFAASDPKAALEWAMSLPKFPNDPVPPGLGCIVEGWHSREPDAAVAWVMQSRNEPWWPRAVNGLIDAMRNHGNSADVPALLAQFEPDVQAAIEYDRVRPKPTQTTVR